MRVNGEEIVENSINGLVVFDRVVADQGAETPICVVGDKLHIVDFDCASILDKIKALEALITQFQDNVDNVDNDYASILSKIKALEALITQLQDNVDNVDNDYTSILDKIRALEAFIAQLQNNVATVNATIGDNYNEIINVVNTGDFSLAERILQLKAEVEAAFAQLRETMRVYADNNTALAEYLQQLEANYAGNLATVMQQYETISNATSAIATAQTQLSSTIGGHTASLEQLYQTTAEIADGVERLKAEAYVLTTVNGRVSGWKNLNTGDTGSFEVLADSFFVSDGTSRYTPFSVVNGTVYVGSNAMTPMMFVGSFASAPDPNQYPINSVYRNTTTKKTYILNQSRVWVEYLQDGRDGIDGAPGARGAGFFTAAVSSAGWSNAAADNAIAAMGYTKVLGDRVTLYYAAGNWSETRHWDGSDWASSALVVTGNMLVTGSITGDKLAANTITGDKLAVNTIDADHIKAKSIDTNQIKIGGVTTEDIALNAITFVSSYTFPDIYKDEITSGGANTVEITLIDTGPIGTEEGTHLVFVELSISMALTTGEAEYLGITLYINGKKTEHIILVTHGSFIHDGYIIIKSFVIGSINNLKLTLSLWYFEATDCWFKNIRITTINFKR